MKRIDINWFNHKSGAKLTKTQAWIVKNIAWKIETYSPFIIPLAVIGGIIYTILHFIIKYW